MEEKERARGGIRYLLISYIALFLVAVPAFIITFPVMKQNMAKSGLPVHYRLWKGRIDGGARDCVDVVLLSYDGPGVVTRESSGYYPSSLHRTLETLLSPIRDSESAMGFIPAVDPSVRLVGATVVENIAFVTLSPSFLLSADIDMSLDAIEKTLRLNEGTEGLVLFSGDMRFTR